MSTILSDSVRGSTVPCRLDAEHLADLHKSGLSDETIVTMRARSVAAPELARLLEYKPAGVASALALPYPGSGFERYKLFPPTRNHDGHAVRYLQARGSGVHLYILPAVRAVLPDHRIPIAYTEGEKKAAKATQEGIHCVGLGGLWNWIEAGTADGIAELDAIAHVNRDSRIIPDSDVWTRPDLLRAVYALGKELESRGAVVSVLILPQDGDIKIGLDDFLITRDIGELRKLGRLTLRDKAFTKQAEWHKPWKQNRSNHSDALVEPAKTGQGAALKLEAPKPSPEPVNGAELLDHIAATVTRYIVLPPDGAVALALWTLHTYVVDGLHASPILSLTSPQKRSGKSTTLEVLHAMVCKPLLASNISPAALFRTVEMARPTLLIDEADTFLVASDDLRGILNAGHTRTTARVIRTVGTEFEPRAFTTFCPKVVAAIGELPGTIQDRSIMLRMKRRAAGEHVERLRRDRITAELAPLREQAARWAQDHMELLADQDPHMPAVHDRAADNWRPLVAIADLAGGEWPHRVRKAALALSGEVEDQDVGVLLLSDISGLFEAHDTDRLPSQTVVSDLLKLEDRPWPEMGSQHRPLTVRGLARLLKPFGIMPKTVRVSGSETLKGYNRTDFSDAFARYLLAEPSQCHNPHQLRARDVLHASQMPPRDGSTGVTSAYSNEACDVVSDTKGKPSESSGADLGVPACEDYWP